MKGLTNAEARVVAELLDRASDVFGNHCCNDFDLSDAMSVEERRELVRKYHEYNGDPEEFDPEDDCEYHADFALMSYFAARLRGDAE